jgi:YD repeat-containing protein
LRGRVRVGGVPGTDDPEVDVLHILLRNVPVEESDEDKPGVTLDYDKEGNIVGIEILDASMHVEDPHSVQHAVTR